MARWFWTTVVLRESCEEGLVDEVPLGAIGEEVAAAADGVDLVLDTDGGSEAAEKEASTAEDAPDAVEHGTEVGVVAGEVEDGVHNRNVGEGVGEGRGFDRFGAEVLRREMRGEAADGVYGAGVGVDGEDVVTRAEQPDEVAASTAAGVEDAGARRDSAAEELVE
jgi:hypothetical protein